MIVSEDLMTEDESRSIQAEHGSSYVAWEFYSRWLKAYRAENPDDLRDSHELISVFFEWATIGKGKA